MRDLFPENHGSRRRDGGEERGGGDLSVKFKKVHLDDPGGEVGGGVLGRDRCFFGSHPLFFSSLTSSPLFLRGVYDTTHSPHEKQKDVSLTIEVDRSRNVNWETKVKR